MSTSQFHIYNVQCNGNIHVYNTSQYDGDNPDLKAPIPH